MLEQLSEITDLDELEAAIEKIRARLMVKRRCNDPTGVRFLKEWLIDLYYQRKHHPDYHPSKKTSSSCSNREILLSDPELMSVAARSNFLDPFEENEKAEAEEVSPLVSELMDELTTMEWDAVSMVWLGGLGPTEAGYYMECTANNVSTYLMRARVKMLTKLNTASQMVLAGFDLPPVVRRKRSPKAGNSTKEEDPQSVNQLAMF